MKGNTDMCDSSPVLQISREYTKEYDGVVDHVTETVQVDQHEVERLLQEALRGSLDGVDPETIWAELEARANA